jgi:hypothetical protein
MMILPIAMDTAITRELSSMIDSGGAPALDMPWLSMKL